MENTILDKKLKYWEDQLLDLGKRNKMISYRETKRSTLKIKKPSFEDMYQKIVIDEQELTFEKAIDRDSDIRVYSILSLFKNLSSPIEVNVGDIKAEGELPEINKTLKHLRSKSKLAIDEQGLNILYLVFGFIEWHEKNARSNNWIKSPLMLVPVSLVLPSLNSHYYLKKNDDEIVVNPTLSYLFEHDYGITLPEFDSDNNSLDDFIKQMENLVNDRGWRIVRECSIGLVSFSKISMYNDLKKNEEQMKMNPIIRAFAGEKNEINSKDNFISEFDHDTCKATNSYQVLDADSSQQDAIELSKKGISFVMQGPPGTGKSQTITNIIAQGLADGKKILFVSEKMAALDVVYRRLHDVKLSDFCLSLHSHKANKKDIIEQLGNNLNLKPIKVKDDALNKLARLDRLKNELKNYVKDIHTVIEPLGMSLYEVYGLITQLEDIQDIDINISNIDKLTRDQLNNLILLVENLDKTQAKLGYKWYKNPWKDISCYYLDMSKKRELKDKLYTSLHIISDLEKCYIIEKTLADTLTIYKLDIFLNLYEQAKYCGNVPNDWFFRSIEKEENIIKNIFDGKNTIDNITETLSKKYETEFFELDGDKLILEYKNAVDVYRNIIYSISSDEEAFERIETDYKEIKCLYEMEKHLIEAFNDLTKEYNLKLPCENNSFEYLINVLNMVQENRNLTKFYFEQEYIRKYIDDIRSTIILLENKKENLCKKYLDSILEINDVEQYICKLNIAKEVFKNINFENNSEYLLLNTISSYDINKIKTISNLLNNPIRNEIFNRYGIEEIPTLQNIYKQLSAIECLPYTKSILKWKSYDERKFTNEFILKLIEYTEKLNNEKQQLNGYFNECGININVENFKSEDLDNLCKMDWLIPEPDIIVESCENEESYKLLETIDGNIIKLTDLTQKIDYFRNEYNIIEKIDNDKIFNIFKKVSSEIQSCNPKIKWIDSKDSIYEIYNNIVKYSNILKEKNKEFTNQYNDMIFSFDAIGILDRLNINIPERDILINNCDSIEAYSLLEEIDYNITEINNISNKIENIIIEYNISKEIDINEIFNIFNSQKSSVEFCNPCLSWTIDETDFHNFIENIINIANDLKNQYNRIISLYEKSVFDFDYVDVLNRFKSEYNSIFKIFKKSYYNDKKRVRILFRDVRKKIEDEEIITLLQDLHKYNEELNKYNNLSNKIKELFGVEEYDIWYDWEKLKNMLYSFEEFCLLFENRESAYNFIINRSWDNILVPLNKYTELKKWFDENEKAKNLYGCLYNNVNTNTDIIKDALNKTKIYKEDINKINESLKDKSKNISEVEIKLFLENLCNYNEQLDKYNSLSNDIKILFDIEKYDIWYNWSTIKKRVDVFYEMCQLFDNNNNTYDFINSGYFNEFFNYLNDFITLNNWFNNNEQSKLFYGSLYKKYNTDTNEIREILNHSKYICKFFNSNIHYINFINNFNEEYFKNIVTCANNIVDIREWFISKHKEIEDYTGVAYNESVNLWEQVLESLNKYENIVDVFGESITFSIVANYHKDVDFITNYYNVLKDITNIEDCIKNIYNIETISEEFYDVDIRELIININKIMDTTKEIISIYDLVSNYCSSQYKTLSISNIKSDFEELLSYQNVKSKFIDLDLEGNNILGYNYNGIETDWNIIENNICFCEKINTLLLGNVSLEMINAFVNKSSIYPKSKLSELNKYLVLAKEIDSKYKEISSIKKVDNKINVLNKIIDNMEIAINIKNKIIANSFYECTFYSFMEGLQSLAIMQNKKVKYSEDLSIAQKLMPTLNISNKSDFSEIIEVFNHIKNIKSILNSNDIDSELIKLITNGIDKISINSYNTQIEKLIKYKEYFTDITSLFSNKDVLESYNFKKLGIRFENCNEQFETIDLCIDLRECKKECVDNGLSDFIIKAEDIYYTEGTLKDIFLKCFYSKWIEKVCANIKSVSNFRAYKQDSKVEEFVELDIINLPINQERIRERLIKGMPTKTNFNRVTDEMSILLHELNKKRNIMPLRKLFRTIPNLVLKLKPCLMMSPLSVAYFLEAETYKFDMVIFDEASQIFPQDAIGAISRGSQVIITGDSKQLPPTNFFATNKNIDGDFDTDDETDEYEDIVFDSILEEATNSLYNHSLLWHYRSRFEDLISFSNQKIYKNNLITFPSSIVKEPDTGVECIYVENGVYDKRCNRTEAIEIVRLVDEHIKKHRNCSLGIIAFSESQQSVIEEEINKYRVENQMYEEFFDENSEEPFFVKNLENVQGDERDTIIFSICYGKNSSGKMNMYFGPLNKQGGERRLNVAITRAKYSLQGTTQGNGLTGGLPPVRFSM